VTEREIHDAYERIRPDEGAKARMLAKVLTAAEEARGGKRSRGVSIRRGILIAAVLTGAVILTAFCYVTDIFGLRQVNLGPENLTIPEVQEDGTLTYDTVTVNSISMQGLVGSPEYEACREWTEYVNGYDPDGSIIASIGNGPTGVSAAYDAYLCYTQEMADELDRICERYGLTLLGSSAMESDVGTMLDQVSAEGLFDTALEGVSNEASWGYYYNEGTFFLEGLATFSGERPKHIDYQFSRAMKGSMSTLTLNIGKEEDYEQWVYTTKNGVPLLLATDNTTKALVIADREESFVVINVLGDWMNGTFDLSHEDLEIFAETFDFTAIG